MVMLSELNPRVDGRPWLAVKKVTPLHVLLSCPAQFTGEFYHLDKYPHLSADFFLLRDQRSPEITGTAHLISSRWSQLIPHVHFKVQGSWLAGVLTLWLKALFLPLMPTYITCSTDWVALTSQPDWMEQAKCQHFPVRIFVLNAEIRLKSQVLYFLVVLIINNFSWHLTSVHGMLCVRCTPLWRI